MSRRCKPYGKWRGCCRVRTPPLEIGSMVYCTSGGGTARPMIVRREWINHRTQEHKVWLTVPGLRIGGSVLRKYVTAECDV